MSPRNADKGMNCRFDIASGAAKRSKSARKSSNTSRW
jgi:hypothetical protein